MSAATLSAMFARAYLARYLMPVDVPAEYMQDDMLGDLAARLKELQSEFKEVHKTVDQLRDTNLRRAAATTTRPVAGTERRW